MVKIEDINIEKWNSLLNDLRLKKNEPSTHVVCLVQNEKERSFEVLSKKDWEEFSKNPLLQHKYSKLKLKQIISISNQLFSQVSITVLSNPFNFFSMPIKYWRKCWRKPYYCRLKSLVPSIVCKNLLFHQDKIIKNLKKEEDQRQQLIGIYSTLKVMTEKSDIQKTKSIWERCIYWLSDLFFETATKKIERILKEDLEKSLPLEIGTKYFKVDTLKATNVNLLRIGQKALSSDEFFAKFANGLEVRDWATQKFEVTNMHDIKQYSHLWDRLEEENVKAKQAFEAKKKGLVAQPANINKDQKVDDVAKQNLNPPLNQKPVHSPLADKILEEAVSKNRDDLNEIEKIVLTKEFSLNPTTYLIDLIIKRGFSRLRMGESSLAFIIVHIPNFTKDISSIDFLRSIAKTRYDKLDNKDEIMQVLEGSFKDKTFLYMLDKVVRLLNTHDQQRHLNALAEAESDLRLVFNAFNQAVELKTFSLFIQ